MLYHKDCKATDEREHGFPLESVQRRSNGRETFRCRACGRMWSIWDDAINLPADMIETPPDLSGLAQAHFDRLGGPL